MFNQQYSDEEIIAGCKSGDAKMQEALYNLFASRMIAICSRYTGNRMEAEDVFHDTFIKVFDKIRGFKGGNLKSWMYRVFINSSIDYYKSSKKNQEVDYNEVEQSDGSYMEILSKLSVDELTSIINQLPVGYKMVFNLYVIDGYTHKEIADQLNITVGTSKSQLFKAKGMLVQMLDNNNISRYAI